MSADGCAAGNGIPLEGGRLSGSAESPSQQFTDSATDEEALIRALMSSEFEGRANNGALRQALGWEQGRYFAVRNRLLDKGQVQKAHGGPGGMTVLVAQPEPAPAAAPAEAEPSPSSIQDEYNKEKELYDPMLRQIETVWVKEEGYDSSLCRCTAALGKRDTGGKWTRPDITVVAVQKFKFLREPVFDVITFEIKPKGNITVEGVFEALAHRQYTNRSSVIYHITVDDFDKANEHIRIETLAEQHGIGLYLAKNPCDYETWVERVRAKRSIPDPQDLNDFIGRTFPPADHDEIIKLAK